MARYEINGGHPLNGTVTISGAKNAAVAILPAALLDLPYLGKGLGMAWRLWRKRLTTFGVTRLSAEGDVSSLKLVIRII